MKIKFPIFIQTEGDRWKKDQAWKLKANPIAQQAEEKWNQTDLRMLEKRRKQRLLKNQASESAWKSDISSKVKGF